MEWFEAWTLKAAGWLALVAVTSTISYLILQTALESRPLMSWPRRIASVLAAAYIASPVAELLFGIVNNLGNGNYWGQFVSALIASSAALVGALFLIPPNRKSATDQVETGRPALGPPSINPTAVIPGHSVNSAPNRRTREQPSGRPLSNYDSRVREIRSRLTNGELSLIRASVSELTAEKVRSRWLTGLSRDLGQKLEMSQTWWRGSADDSPLVALFVYVSNDTAHTIGTMVFELWDVPGTELPKVKLWYELVLERSLERGEAAVIRASLLIPSRHPSNAGRVNADIIAAI